VPYLVASKDVNPIELLCITKGIEMANRSRLPSFLSRAFARATGLSERVRDLRFHTHISPSRLISTNFDEVRDSRLVDVGSLGFVFLVALDHWSNGHRGYSVARGTISLVVTTIILPTIGKLVPLTVESSLTVGSSPRADTHGLRDVEPAVPLGHN
jgi:hypothetical protein